MDLRDTLANIQQIAEYYLIDRPFIVGGIPRDIAIGNRVKTDDIDITTNTADAPRLGILVADRLGVRFRLFDDGHVTAYFPDFDVDFSSNYISEEAVSYLKSEGKDDPLLYEVYSRDFTLNTLMQDIQTREIKDPLGIGLKDIEDRIIRTPVPAEITISNDPRRVYRAINLAARYGFDIDSDIINFVKSNPDVVDGISERMISQKIKEALEADENKTFDLLREMNLLGNVPMTGAFKERVMHRKLLLEYLRSSG